MAGFFGLGNYNSPGPGVRKDEPEKKGAARFFDILGKRFWKLINLNFLYVLFSIIPFALMWGVCTVSIVFTLGLAMSPEEAASWLTESGGTMFIFLFSLIVYSNGTGGAAACGLVNVLRKYVSDSHAWVWQDFIDAFKRCFKKATVAYIVDLAATGVLIINFGFYNVQSGPVAFVLRTLLLLVIFVWAMMHVYIYPVITSFNFKLRDVYKNSFIMVIGKLPQTIFAFLLGAVVSGLIITLSVGIIYIAIIIPIFLFSFCEYARLSVSYPLIVKYMTDTDITPPEEKKPIGEDEAVFSDDRTDNK